MAIIYDISSFEGHNIPFTSPNDWVKITTSKNQKDKYWLTRKFIDTYGVDVFWRYKDQQIQQMYGKTLTSTEKIKYIDLMMADEINYQ